MYTILTTCPPYGSRNVGDELIERRTKDLIDLERGESEYLTIFREEPLDDRLDDINATRAVLMPAFPIRDTPMHPGTYRLTADLSRIKVPLIPVGANWNVYPGDALSRRTTVYSQATVDFLKQVAGQVERISCREHHVGEVLGRHGISNTWMTGDPAWFFPEALGRPMHRPKRVERVVFSPPLSAYYADQARRVMAMLAARFPDAERICAFHLFDAEVGEDATGETGSEADAGAGSGSRRSENSAALSADVTAKNRLIREAAGDLGYTIWQMAGDLVKLDRYETCDLHVGYECHAHLNFFSRRRPSVLIAEDARGVGFNDTLGVGGFTGFVRSQHEAGAARKAITSGYATTLDELALAPPSVTVEREIDAFLAGEVESRFARYVGLAVHLDTVYREAMQPFIRSLP